MRFKSIFSFAVTCISLWFLLVECSSIPLQPYPNVLDVVTLAIKPTCINRQSIISLNKYLVPKPRAIHVVTSKNCNSFSTFAKNVVCHPENTLIPGLTNRQVSEWVNARFRKRSRQDRKTASKRASWYFQQLLKLAVASHIRGLSDHFLVFDSDMIPVRPLTWFVPQDAAPGNLTGVMSQKEWAAVQGDGQPPPGTEGGGSVPSGQTCTNPFPFRTLIHIGGWAPMHGYMDTYKQLTGKNIRWGRDRHSLVTHNMLVYRPYMEQFLGNITAEKYRNVTLGWALSILDAVATLPSMNRVMVGFSEFWSYLSWVLESYPCTAVQADRTEWARISVEPGQASPFLPVSVFHRGAFVPVCCPAPSSLSSGVKKGYVFMGYELSHLRFCNYHHEAFREGYAEWFNPV